MSDVVFVAICVAFGAVAGWAMRPLVAKYDSAVPNWLPVPEVLTALLFGLAAAQYDDWRLVALMILLAGCVALTIVDLVQYRLPNHILFPTLCASALVLLVGELVDGDADVLWHGLIGALVYSFILLVMHMISPAGMGFGDVKLALLLGMFVGWVADSRFDAIRAVMLALLIGSALGVILGVGRMAVTKLGGKFLPDPEEGSAGEGWRRTTFPFGPPLMIGAILVTLYPGTFLPA